VALLFLVVATAVINFAFLGEYTFRPLWEDDFQSVFFQCVRGWGEGAEWVRVPVPCPYLQGLD
jgi:hypothetical protein